MLPIRATLAAGGSAHIFIEAKSLMTAQSGQEPPATKEVVGKWTVFDFWAPWCKACKTLDAQLRERARALPELAVRRINIVDFDSAIARRELPGVSVLPHVRLFDPSGRAVFEAGASPSELLEQIDAHLQRSTSP